MLRLILIFILIIILLSLIKGMFKKIMTNTSSSGTKNNSDKEVNSVIKKKDEIIDDAKFEDLK